MNKIIKLTTLLLTFTTAVAFSNTASATATPNNGENWGGTQGIATPTLWTEGHGNVVGSHFMRMSMDPQTGERKMDPAGMLMQHHFANHDGAGLNVVGGISSAISGAEPGASTVTVDLGNFSDPSFDSTLMRVEVLSFLDTGIATIDTPTATGATATQVGETFTQNGATWTSPAGMMKDFDYTYADYSFDSAADGEQIVINANGSNIAQVFVWTEQVASDVSAVPVPAAVWLFGSAMIGLLTTSRSRKLS
jgi:hypothetical protein